MSTKVARRRTGPAVTSRLRIAVIATAAKQAALLLDPNTKQKGRGNGHFLSGLRRALGS